MSDDTSKATARALEAAAGMTVRLREFWQLPPNEREALGTLEAVVIAPALDAFAASEQAELLAALGSMDQWIKDRRLDTDLDPRLDWHLIEARAALAKAEEWR